MAYEGGGKIKNKRGAEAPKPYSRNTVRTFRLWITYLVHVMPVKIKSCQFYDSRASQLLTSNSSFLKELITHLGLG